MGQLLVAFRLLFGCQLAIFIRAFGYFLPHKGALVKIICWK